MELSEVVNTQYAFPVGLVLICAIFVFAFGFKSSEPPAFDQLTHAADDRKPSGKKRKTKEKKTQSNGPAVQHNIDDGTGKKNKVSENSQKASGKASKASKEMKSDLEKTASKATSKSQVKSQALNKQTSSQKENVNGAPLGDKNTSKELQNKNTLDVTSKQKKEKQLSSKKITGNKEEKVNDFHITNHVSNMKGKSEEKAVLKERKSNIQSQVKTNKGRDAPIQDTYNQKNTKGASKAKKNEEKPIDFDDGEWERALSRKDKKNRKKDDDVQNVALSVEENDVKKQEVNTQSKKASKNQEDTQMSVAVQNDNVKVDDKSVKSKGKKKDATQKEKNIDVNADKEELPLENVVEQPTKAKKKKKSGSTHEPKEGKNTQEPSLSTQVVGNSPKIIEEKSKPEILEVQSKVLPVESQEMKIDPASAVVFDELGDIWKEAKVPKKSKKKVRKDQ